MGAIPEPARPNYRPDIDGLRGLAVLAVVAYHAFPAALPAGFIGVDVFFVISGYLIAGIILSALKRGRFSFREFYLRRVRRIFPALVVVSLPVFVAGWFTLQSDEFRRLGAHLLGGAAFSSNLVLRAESGYFDIGADRKILLHLWSLAIEEQFYLVFPLLLWAAHRLRRSPLTAIGAVGGASFAWNVVMAAKDPAAGFYALQARAWELMLGAALASASSHAPAWIADARSRLDRWLSDGGRRIPGWPKEGTLRKIASAAGAYLLGLAFLLIVEGEAYPSWWALLPTAGTTLLIAGGPDAMIGRRILSGRLLVGIGLISYPLYLWHWPLLAFARILNGGTPAWPVRAALALLAIALAWCTYRFVERPARSGVGILASSLVVALLSVGIAGFAAYWSGGFPDRPVAHRLESYVKSIRVATGQTDCVFVADPGWFCRLGSDRSEPAAFIFGDSHAGSMLPAFAKLGHETGAEFLYALTKACASEDSCLEDERRIFAYVKDHGIRNVLVLFRWSNYDFPDASGRGTRMEAWLDRTVKAYRSIGAHVYLFADNPVQRELPEDTLRKSMNTDNGINRHAVSASDDALAQGRLDAILARYAGDGVTVLDLSDVYCRRGICPLAKDGRFLYADTHHLSVDGALLAYPELKEALRGL